MLRFDANITSMYGKLPVTEALERAKADGFDAVECRSPFDEPAATVAAALDRLGMRMVQFNTPMGDFAAGERGMACIPGRKAEFRESIELTLDYARAIRPPQINCPGGVAAPDVPRAEQEALLAENLAWAAGRFAEEGIRLQLEGINPVDNPGILVGTAADAMRVIDAAGHPNLWLQYDFYHNQVTGGDLVGTFLRYRERINHVQFADHPGRHEPGTGEINYAFVMRELDRAGYDGWVGLEYAPAGAVRDGLGWLDEYRAGI
ncbi:TIM barrel protein [Rhodobacterales bacterium HKCCE2091]|nr:TIM barrel protein [Rhodobacterales bacterium HKCCE2091]